MSEVRESMWAAALRHRLDHLRCPKCGDANQPDVHPIGLDDEGRAHCTVCRHVWIAA